MMAMILRELNRPSVYSSRAAAARIATAGDR
jgi:hypothetical protein